MVPTISNSKSIIYFAITSVAVISLLYLPFIVDLIFLLPAFLFGILLFTYLVIVRFDIPFKHIILTLIATSILTPPIQLSSSLPLIRIDEILIYSLSPIIIAANSKGFSFDKNTRVFIYIYCSFLGCVLFSTFYGYLNLGVPVSTRDFFEIITLSKYLLLFIALRTFKYNKNDVKPLLYFILSVVLLSGAFGLLQYFGVFGLDHITGPLYLQDRIHIVDDRLTGTYKNPNTYSAILVIAGLIALALFFFEEQKTRKPFLLWSLAAIAVLLFFAGSRTMIACFFLAIILMVLIGAYRSKLKTSQLLILLFILGTGSLLAISFVSLEIVSRLQSGLDLLGDDSLAMRFVVWYLNIMIFLDSPLIGWGPAKDLFTTVVDNEFLLILRRFGVVGFVPFIMIYLHPLFMSLRFVKDKFHNDIILNSIILASIFTFLFAGLTNSLFHDLQVMDFWIVLLTVFYSVNSQNSNTHS